jgi:hypothetical protein
MIVGIEHQALVHQHGRRGWQAQGGRHHRWRCRRRHAHVLELPVLLRHGRRHRPVPRGRHASRRDQAVGGGRHHADRPQDDRLFRPAQPPDRRRHGRLRRQRHPPVHGVRRPGPLLAQEPAVLRLRRHAAVDHARLRHARPGRHRDVPGFHHGHARLPRPHYVGHQRAEPDLHHRQEQPGPGGVRRRRAVERHHLPLQRLRQPGAGDGSRRQRHHRHLRRARAQDKRERPRPRRHHRHVQCPRPTEDADRCGFPRHHRHLRPAGPHDEPCGIRPHGHLGLRHGHQRHRQAGLGLDQHRLQPRALSTIRWAARARRRSPSPAALPPPTPSTPSRAG